MLNDKIFKSWIVTEIAPSQFISKLADKKISQLPPGDILIRVHYSSINYKDVLSFSGHKGITRQYPHTPGIDAAGIVEHSNCSEFQKGDKVLVTGFDLGMNTSGGFSQYIRVPSSWVIKCPSNISLKESMIYGTAGMTAALSVMKLQLR